MDRMIDLIEKNSKVFSIIFFFLWGIFLILFSLHTNIFPKILYALTVNALVVGQFYLGFLKKDGRRHWLGIILGSITGLYTLLIDAIAIFF